MKFKSSVYTQASGSIGGLTYSHNKGGMYTRARAIPVNANSIRQQWIRASMGSLVQAWNFLTDAQRTSWNLYAFNTPVLNVLGEMITLSGQQQFIRSNSIRKQVTAATLDFVAPITLANIVSAPTVYNTGQPVTGLGTVALDAGDLTFTATIGGAEAVAKRVVVYAGRPLNAGAAFYKGPYQLANVTASIIAATTTATFTISVVNAEEWYTTNTVTADVQLPLRLRVLYDDGRLSEAFAQVVIPEAA